MNDQGSSNAAKLQLGQQVEVRQRVKGLRGSWHPAKIVGLRPGRRLVEYDELLTDDGLSKLRESVPVGKHVDGLRSSARNTISSPPRKFRGFLRPSPPSFSGPPLDSWQRGFLVDVFYEDAWWEAVLLEDLIGMGEATSIQVLYPDEGDTGRVAVSNLRVSQEWDEDSGQWSVKGKCILLGKTTATKGHAGFESLVIDRTSSQNQECDSQFMPSGPSPIIQNGKILDTQIDFKDAGIVQEKAVYRKGLDCVSEDMSLCNANKLTYGMGEHVNALLLDQEALLGKRLSFSEQVCEKGPNSTESVQVAMLEKLGNGFFPLGASVPDSGHVRYFSRACVQTFATAEGERSTTNDLHIIPKVNGCYSSPIVSEACTESFGRKNLVDDANYTLITHSKERLCLSNPLKDDYLQISMNGNSPILDRIQKQCIRSEGLCSSMKRSEKEMSFNEVSDQEQSELQASTEMTQKSRQTEAVLSSRQCQDVESTDIQLAIKTKANSTEHCMKENTGQLFRRSIVERSDLGDRVNTKKKRVTAIAGMKGERYKPAVSSSSMSAQLKGKVKLRASSLKLRKREPKEKVSIDEERSWQNYCTQKKDDKLLHSVSTSLRDAGNLSVVEHKSSSQKSDLQLAELKNKVRRIAKAALLEAGFRIEFRPRKNRDYLDPVYVSPEGRTYWSLPKAWQAWKTVQATRAQERGEGSTSRYGLIGSLLCRADVKGKVVGGAPTKVGNRRQKQLGGLFAEASSNRDYRVSFLANQEMLLKLALKKFGSDSIKAMNYSSKQFRRLQLTKSELAEFFLEDLGILKRITKKVKAKMIEASGHMQPEKASKGQRLSISQTQKLSSAPDVIVGKREKRTKEGSGTESKSIVSSVHRKLSSKKNPPIGESMKTHSRPTVKALMQKNGGGKTASVLGFHVQRGKKKSTGQVKGENSQVHVDNCTVQKSYRKEIRCSKKEKIAACNDCEMEPEFRSKKRRRICRDKTLFSNNIVIEQEFNSKRNQVSRKVKKTVSNESGIVLESVAEQRPGSRKQKTSIPDATSKKRKTSLSDSVLSHQPKVKKLNSISGKQIKLSSIGKKNHAVRSGCRLQVRPSSSRKGEGTNPFSCKSKQTVLSWLIDRGVLTEKEKAHYVNRKSNEIMKEGVVTREGILCNCCNKIFTICDFKVHAGSRLQRSGRSIVFTDGRCLLDCQLQAWAIETQLRKPENYVGVTEDDRNDDTCALCGDGGDLICCDHCPSTFHVSCLQMKVIPEGSWYCPKCCCAVCGGSHFDDTEEGKDKPFVFCVQCEHKYHTSCLHAGGISIDHGWLCGNRCEKIYKGLRSLVGVSHRLEGGYSWTLLRCTEDEQEFLPLKNLEIDAELHCKLAVALTVMQECFVPIVDPRTNIDVIPHVVYNCWSEFDRLNYGGFYTVLLMRGDEIISVASIRVHGVRLAEMPLIGTREQYRRQGMCRLLVNAIEKMLHSLCVQRFVLPAIPELLETWTKAFGFHPWGALQRYNFSDTSMMMFPGTQLLEKLLVQSEVKLRDVELGNCKQSSCFSDSTKYKSEIKMEGMQQFEKLSATISGVNFQDGSHNEGQKTGAISSYDEDRISNKLKGKSSSQADISSTGSPLIAEEKGPEDGIEEMQVRNVTHEQCLAGIGYLYVQQIEDQVLAPTPNHIEAVNNQDKLHTYPQKCSDNGCLYGKKQQDFWNENSEETTYSQNQVNSSLGVAASFTNLNAEEMSKRGSAKNEEKWPQEWHLWDFCGSPSDYGKKKISAAMTPYGKVGFCNEAGDTFCNVCLTVSGCQCSDSRSELPAEVLCRLDSNVEASVEMNLINENMLSVDSLNINSFVDGKRIGGGQPDSTILSERVIDEQYIDAGCTDNKDDWQSFEGDQLERREFQNDTNFATDDECIVSSRLMTGYVTNTFKLPTEEKQTSKLN